MPTWRFAGIIFVGFAIAAPLIWHFASLLTRALLFGLPPISFWMADYEQAILIGALCFAVPTAFYAGYYQRFSFTVLFLISGIVCCVISLYSVLFQGQGFGFAFGFIGWPMLAYSTMAMGCWYVITNILRKFD